MAKQMVAELTSGTMVDSIFVLTKKQLYPYRDPGKGFYLALGLADRTGEIEAKVWQNAEQIASKLLIEQLVCVQGRVEDYRGTPQMIIQAITPHPHAEALDLRDFLPTTTADLEALKGELKRLIYSVRESHLATLLQDWFSDKEFAKAYCTAPAAKRIHHAYLGGLLEHSLEVARFAECAAAVFPAINRDLAVTGALLHDIGKISEYQYGRTINLTDQGCLLGHTVLGYELLQARLATIKGFPAALATHLGHLILSHHGELQFGAPVLPQTIEAVVIHQADLASARIKQCLQLIEQGSQDPNSAWSPFEPTLNRNFYLGFMRTG